MQDTGIQGRPMKAGRRRQRWNAPKRRQSLPPAAAKRRKQSRKRRRRRRGVPLTRPRPVAAPGARPRDGVGRRSGTTRPAGPGRRRRLGGQAARRRDCKCFF